MRIFVSYARVDKSYCIQIIDKLSVHDVWCDQRLYAGQGWWKEIMRRLDWCEGLIYLLSPDSVASDYCNREFELAQSLGRYIFPVLIHPETPIPKTLKDTQYADLTKGITADAIASLLNSIYLATEHSKNEQYLPETQINVENVRLPQINNPQIVAHAATAMGNGDYDKAIFLLKQAKTEGYVSRFINIDRMIAEAETALERQSKMREAERDYRQIAELIKHKITRRFGCEALNAFFQDFPNYDPDHLQDICQSQENDVEVPIVIRSDEIPVIEWCEIPAGTLKIDPYKNKEGDSDSATYIESFKIGKFPITNAQFQYFIDAPDGYNNPEWWQFTPEASQWYKANAHPHQPNFRGAERPREMINWYESVAFCCWLTEKTGKQIVLPTVEQRQRSIQGEDDRIYPWGHNFERERCNTHESEIKMTTLVNRFPDGVSPYGVYDLVGNVWEWCLNWERDPNEPNTELKKRAVHGGSFVSPYKRARINFRYYLNPQTHFTSIGFRILQLS